MDKQDKYEERGAARWGENVWTSMGVSWPLARLIITQEYIEISALRITQFHFDRQTIREIRSVRQLWYTFALIIHTKDEYPQYIAYGPQHFESLRANLDKFGYPIKD